MVSVLLGAACIGLWIVAVTKVCFSVRLAVWLDNLQARWSR